MKLSVMKPQKAVPGIGGGFFCGKTFATEDTEVTEKFKAKAFYMDTQDEEDMNL
jgi:hypothetical protein